MARELSPYLLVDRRYFETFGRMKVSDRYREISQSLLPQTWKLVREDVWLKTLIEDGEEGPLQGFKIHISVTPAHSEELLRLAVPICVEEGVRFKHVADVELLAFMSSKNFGRGSSGKFFVIYPNDVEQLGRMLERLYGLTGHMEGAYVLSDNRYRDSKVLYYRYGGFAPMYRLTADGSRIPLIFDPQGKPYDDERNPVFSLPPWVEDPFPAEDSDDDDDAALAGRYEVKSSLSFSNSGGVYVALDRQTGREVVIKEARPLTNLNMGPDGSIIDAVTLLHNEYDNLERLKELPCVVTPIEIFQEWEHTFLVEERVDAMPLINYRARDDFHLFPFRRDPEQLRSFGTRFRQIGLNLIAAISAIHGKGVVLGDISPANILIDPETLEVVFIDLENAIRDESDDALKRLSSLWSTPGFREGRYDGQKIVAENDDLFGLGMTLLSLLVPATSMLDLEKDADQRCFEKMQACTSLPTPVAACIAALRRYDAAGARQILEDWDVEASVRAVAEDPSPEPVWRPAAGELERAIARIGDHIESTTTADRRDRLWPCDFRQFSNGPEGLGFGASGIALFLARTRGGIAEEVRSWLLERQLDPRLHAPGLFTGMAGVAYAFQQIGLVERGLEILDLSARSPLVGADPSFFQGAAGWGWVHLYFHRVHRQEEFLQRAVQIGEHLLSTSELDDEGRYWADAQKKINYGLGHGGSGVALFLLELSKASGDSRFVQAGREALAFETSRGIERPSGGLGWVRNEGDNASMPYWRYGSAGVGSVAIRYYREHGEVAHLELARQAATEAFNRFTVHVDQLEGLAGIGEFLIDMSLVTGEEAYLDQAHDLADSILRYRVESAEGMAFPGRLLIRLSHDFGTGSAGVGLFFDRLLSPGPRLLQDLEADCLADRPAVTSPTTETDRELILEPA